MAEVQVIIPENGNPLVQSPEESVIPNACVYWHVHCFNRAVASVEIKFESSTALFFEDPKGTPTNQIDRPLDYYTYDRPTGAEVGEAMVWGRAPRSYGKRVEDKYTVRGLSATGKDLVAIDPKIIVDGP